MTNEELRALVLSDFEECGGQDDFISTSGPWWSAIIGWVGAEAGPEAGAAAAKIDALIRSRAARIIAVLDANAAMVAALREANQILREFDMDERVDFADAEFWTRVNAAREAARAAIALAENAP